MTFKITSSTGQVTEKSDNIIIENDVNTQAHILNQSTTFPQIHTNLNGMVREFVRRELLVWNKWKWYYPV